MIEKTPVPLSARATPRQKRAEETYEKILIVAAEMLEELGLDAFNTNLLAKCADVRVRTVYRYFPNKFAVLAELARRNTDTAVALFEDFAPLANPAIPLNKGLDMLWRIYFTRLTEIKGFEAVNHACRIYPELQSINKELHPIFSEHLAKAFKQRGIVLPLSRLRVIAALVIETSSALMDYASFETKAKQKSLIAELQAMQLLYLTPIFEDHD